MSDVNTGQGINIGDAVVSFVADMTRLDQGVDTLSARVTAGMAGAGAATEKFGEELDATGENAEYAGEKIQNSMHEARVSIREAKGEAGLLGEAFGIHLPRHVRTFIAEMPGVGNALSAAFAATAVLFIIEAVVKLTEKVSDFISTTFIFTQAMKDSDQSIKDMNKEITDHKAAMDKINLVYEQIGMTAKEKLIDNIKRTTESIGEQRKALEELKNETVQAAVVQMGFWEGVKAKSFDALQWIFAPHALEARKAQEAADAIKKAETEKALAIKKAADEIELTDRTNAANRKQIAVDLANEKHKLLLAEQKERRKEMAQALADLEKELAQSKQALDNAFVDMKMSIKALGTDENTAQIFNPLVKGFLAAEAAAKKFGIQIKSGLIQDIAEAKQAFVLLANSGVAPNNVQMHELATHIQELETKLKNFDKVAGKETKTSMETFKEGFKEGGDELYSFGDAYGSAIGKVIKGEEGLGQAMETATKQFIEQIGARALVQGMFYLAQGIADTFWNPERAGADFTAAAEFLAIGAAATAVGSAIPGGSKGGGGGSYSGPGTGAHGGGMQTTGSGAPTGPTQHTTRFAAGGLVTQPTMAMIGDSPSGGAANEGILPLDNPEAMAKIAHAITARMGVGSGHTFNMHVKGMISDSDTKKLTAKISKMVKAGTTTLHSSNTHRITKRSQ